MDIFSILASIQLDSSEFTASLGAASVAVTDFAKQAVSVGMGFDAAMSQVAATMGKTADEISNLRAYAQEMGATTSFSAVQAAEGLNNLAMAGLSADEQMAVLPATLDLAAAGALSLADAATYTTGAVKGFSDSAENAQYYADLMAKGATLANTNVSQLGAALGDAAATASTYKQRADSVTLSLLRLAEQNVTGTAAATALGSAMKDLYTPTSQAKKQLDALGISAYDSANNARDFNEIINELNFALSGMNDQARAAALSVIFSEQGLDAFNKMAATSADTLERFKLGLSDVAGAASQQAATQLDNLQGKVTIFESSVEGLQIAVSDALTPALENLTVTGTKVVSWLGEVARENPAIVQGITGAAAGVTALSVGIAGLTAVVKIAKAAQDTLNLSMSAMPLMAIAAALGAVVTIAASYTSEVDEMVAATDSLIDSIETSREAHTQNLESLQTNASEISSLRDMLYEEIEASDQSAGSYERINAIVAELNQRVPDLNLAFDAQTNSLNMTKQALDDAIESQIRFAESQIYINDIAENDTSIKKLKQQLEELKDKIKDVDEYTRSHIGKGPGVKVHTREWIELNEAIEDTEEQIKDIEGENENLRKSLDEVADSANNTSDGIGIMFDSTEQATDANAEATATADELKAALDDLESAQSDLNSALEEQAEQGSLSFKTINDLIDSGYALALQIDAETGAVTLNRDMYIALATEKINDQLATLKAKETALLAADANNSEAASAATVAGAYLDAAAAKKLASDEEGADLAAIQAQMAALNAIKAGLGKPIAVSGGGGGRSGGGGGGGSSSKAKTQAEKDLDTYKEILAEMDHERNMDQLSEEEYYSRLEELRGQYLTDKSNISEYRKNLEEIYDYQKDHEEELKELEEEAAEEREEALIDSAETRIKLENSTAEQQIAIWQETLNQLQENGDQAADVEGKIFDLRLDLRNEFYDNVQEINDNILSLETQYQEALASKAQEIYDSFGLFDEIPERQEVSGEQLLENLQNQIALIDEFYGNIQALSDRGVSEELVTAIRDMGPAAADQLSGLLTLSDAQLEEYSNLFGEKQRQANQYAEEGLAELREATDAKIQEQLDSIQSLYDSVAPSLGESFTSGLAAGINAGMSEVVQAAVNVATGAVEATQSTLDIHSPSGVFKDIGRYMSEGMAVGWQEEFENTKKAIQNDMQFGYGNVDFASSGLGTSSSGIINGISSAMNSGYVQQTQPIEIKMVMDSDVVASHVFNPLVDYGKANGRPITGEQYA